MLIIFLGLTTWLIAAAVRWWMTQTYARWRKVPNAIGANGHTIARHILDSNGLQAVQLEVAPGTLSDHYIPSQDRLRLSEAVNNQASVASLAVAAHEVGHALQDFQEYKPMKLKAVLMPVAALSNNIGMGVMLLGIFNGSSQFVNTGMLMLFSGVFIQLLTLPIEFDASKRALQELVRLKLVDSKDLQGAKSMLRAAALTYVAGAASSFAFFAFILFKFIRR